MLSNKDYENFKEAPPGVLFLHYSGSITIAPPNAVIEGGDIEFSSTGKHISWPYHVWLSTNCVTDFDLGEIRLFKRFELLAFLLPKLYPDVSRVLASGWTYVPRYKKDYNIPSRATLEEEREENLYYRMHRHLIRES